MFHAKFRYLTTYVARPESPPRVIVWLYRHPPADTEVACAETSGRDHLLTPPHRAVHLDLVPLERRERPSVVLLLIVGATKPSLLNSHSAVAVWEFADFKVGFHVNIIACYFFWLGAETRRDIL